MAVYAATKAALGMFAQSLRLEVAPLGVRVTELVVGRTETDLCRDALSAEGRAAMHDGRFVHPGDVAATVAAVLAAPAHLDIAPCGRRAVGTGGHAPGTAVRCRT